MLEVPHDVGFKLSLQGTQVGKGEVVRPVVHLVDLLTQGITTLQLTFSWVCNCLRLKAEGVFRY